MAKNDKRCKSDKSVKKLQKEAKSDKKGQKLAKSDKSGRKWQKVAEYIKQLFQSYSINAKSSSPK